MIGPIISTVSLATFLVSAASAAEGNAPAALTDDQMDKVVAGDATVDKQEPAPGVIIVSSGDGVTLLTNLQSSVHPPLVVIIDSELINETALLPPAP